MAVTAVNTTGGPANLYGWIDFDGSGTFSASERSTRVASPAAGGKYRQRLQPAAGGCNRAASQVPSTATFYGGNAYMRFRLSTPAA